MQTGQMLDTSTARFLHTIPRKFHRMLAHIVIIAFRRQALNRMPSRNCRNTRANAS